jgi:hypothetical protein
MIADSIRRAVEQDIEPYECSRLAGYVVEAGPFAIKFVQSQWADYYSTPKPLKVSATPALTWGTATYVTPLVFPLSSALYGRIGLVTEYDASTWRIFDATVPAARSAYVRWARSQPSYADLLLTVHSTQANHALRDQPGAIPYRLCAVQPGSRGRGAHRPRKARVMAVTDWKPKGTIDPGISAIDPGMSTRLNDARFTVLIDEDFKLMDQGLPIQTAQRQIERTTESYQTSHPNKPIGVPIARTDPALPLTISTIYKRGGYLHVYIDP